MIETSDRFRDWDAAYVLGALDGEDRRAYERHLAECPACASGLAEVAGLPGILSKLSSEEAVALLEEDATESFDDRLRDGVHTPGLVQRLAAASSRRRRIRLRALIGSAAVAVLLAVGGVALAVSQTPTPVPVAMTPVQQQVITASMTITKQAWGSRFEWSCSYPGNAGTYRSPVSYDLVVLKKSGQRSVVATWTSSGPHAAGLTASSEIPYADIRSVEIRLSGSATTLLRETL